MSTPNQFFSTVKKAYHLSLTVTSAAEQTIAISPAVNPDKATVVCLSHWYNGGTFPQDLYLSTDGASLKFTPVGAATVTRARFVVIEFY